MSTTVEQSRREVLEHCVRRLKRAGERLAAAEREYAEAQQALYRAREEAGR